MGNQRAMLLLTALVVACLLGLRGDSRFAAGSDHRPATVPVGCG
ncbi:MAG TPA: hypothetical protein VN837_07045 [Chloroflexota bacterium]|nr:hypothetical protein [Chloroflexota bacterium]